MATLNINTQVLHKPGTWGLATPVRGATVQIIDVDAPGKGDDVIFTGITDDSGRVSGQSIEWRDTVPVWIPGHAEGAHWVDGHWEGRVWVPRHLEGGTWVDGHWENQPDLSDVRILQARIVQFTHETRIPYPYVDNGPTPPLIFPWGPAEVVRLHFKILTTPTVAVSTMLSAMQQVYGAMGIQAQQASSETLDLPGLNDLDVGVCAGGLTTPEQNELFLQHRNNVGVNHVAVYFVRSTIPPTNGCAAHPPGVPSCVVTQGATQWTLGHEVGHVLGLAHVNDNNRLMTGNGTANITNPPPDLTRQEVGTMEASRLTTGS